MKNTFVKVLLIATLVLAIFALAGCGGGKCKVTITNDDAAGSIMVADIEGNLVAECEKGTELYVYVDTVGNNILDTLTINGEDVKDQLEDGMLAVQANGKLNIAATYYDRATDPVLEERREMADAAVREMVNTVFTYDKDYTYTLMFKPYEIKAGQYYRGLPYSNYSNTTLHSFMAAGTGEYDENGVYIMGGDKFVNRWELILGNSCADLVYWAWSTFGNSFSFRYVSETTQKRGALRLGDYVYDRDIYVDTKVVCADNGYDVMFDSYALLLKGDAAMNHFDGAGHAIFIAGNVVEYMPDGSIDPDSSYIIYHDQNGAYMDCEVEVNGKTYPALTSTCLDAKKSYSQMFAQGYLPVTCLELIDRDAPVEEVEFTDSETTLNKSSVLKGIIKCNYYMSDYKMTITDKSGNVVQEAFRHSNEQNHKDFDVELFKSLRQENCDQNFDQYGKTDKIDVNALPAGEYHCTLTIYTIKGNQEHVVRDFDFTV